MLKENQKVLFDCEHFSIPEKITIPTSRRSLFLDISKEVRSYNRRVEGLPAFKITDILQLDSEEFCQIKPAVIRGCRISISDGYVKALPLHSTEPIRMFKTNSDAVTIFNLFNGMNEIDQIIDIVTRKTNMSADDATEMTIALFIKLCESRICEPGA